MMAMVMVTNKTMIMIKHRRGKIKQKNTSEPRVPLARGAHSAIPADRIEEQSPEEAWGAGRAIILLGLDRPFHVNL